MLLVNITLRYRCKVRLLQIISIFQGSSLWREKKQKYLKFALFASIYWYLKRTNYKIKKSYLSSSNVNIPIFQVLLPEIKWFNVEFFIESLLTWLKTRRRSPFGSRPTQCNYTSMLTRLFRQDRNLRLEWNSIMAQSGKTVITFETIRQFLNPLVFRRS